MLYIPVTVNNHPIKAFVDSGAQATIMSPSCVQRCNLSHLVNTDWAGIAVGAGTARILGRVLGAEIRVGDNFLPCSFTVMEGKDVDLLLGLDMLKRHRACIDLERNVLRLHGAEVPFLPESEIPRNAFGVGGAADEPAVEGPGGLKIGGRSGAVIPPDDASAPSASASTSASTTGDASISRQGRAMAGQEHQQQQPQQQQIAGQPAIPNVGATPPARQPQQAFPRQHVEQLMALGFSAAEATHALTLAGGNVEVAAGILYG